MSLYKDQVLTIEPTGIEPVGDEQRHGTPRNLFGLWFSANAEIATWMVGVFVVALYGTSLESAAIGIVLGNVAGFGILALLALWGPKYGVPQMVSSRSAFGLRGNVAPATLGFLAGIGWFAINTIFGAYALQTIAGWPYGVALAVMLVLQILLAVYGYNAIHAFETACVIVLAAGFALLGAKTMPAAQWAAFNPHAPLAAGGAIAGFVFATTLAFSYATGWIPYASDYSRYLPGTSSKRAVWWYSFLGCAVPCIALEIMGAATVSAVPTVDLSSALPTQAIAVVLGSGIVAKLVLAVIVVGTLAANCMNLYSGALAAMVAFDVRVKRAVAAVAVGIVGALLSIAGSNPRDTADAYTNFLLLLSYWVAPWAAVVIVDAIKHRHDDTAVARAAWRPGLFAWLAGCAASVPFWSQLWFTGPIARAFPQIGDLSYYAGFSVAAIVMWVVP